MIMARTVHRLLVPLLAAAILATLRASAPTPPVSSRLTGGVFLHRVSAGESLLSLGARFGADYREIARLNGLPPNGALKPGTAIQVDNRHIVPARQDDVQIVINVPQRMLFYFGADGDAAFPVALGRRDWPTPLGEFSIVLAEANPTWDVPKSIQEEMRREGRPVLGKVPPGPDNPLGDYWLGSSLGSVGIHGTNAPSSIYRHATHGCIRLHPDDIRWIYPRVSLATRGRIVYEPVLLAETDRGVFLEAHHDVYRRAGGNPLADLRATAAAAGITNGIDWDTATRVLRERRGIATAVGDGN
jgi:L,D-transpeptidase ErfK/SrfK